MTASQSISEPTQFRLPFPQYSTPQKILVLIGSLLACAPEQQNQRVLEPTPFLKPKELERPAYFSALAAEEAQSQLQNMNALKQQPVSNEEKKSWRFDEAWYSCVLDETQVLYLQNEWVSGIDSSAAQLTNLGACILQKNAPQLLLEDLKVTSFNNESFLIEKLQVERTAASQAAYLKCPWPLPSYATSIDFFQLRKQFTAFKEEAKINQMSKLGASARESLPFLNRLCTLSPFDMQTGSAVSVSELWTQSHSEIKVSFNFNSERQLGNVSYHLRSTEALMNADLVQGDSKESPRCEMRRVNSSHLGGAKIHFDNGCVLSAMTERTIKGKAKLRGDSSRDLSKTSFYYARLNFSVLELAQTSIKPANHDVPADAAVAAAWFTGGSVGLELGQWKGSLTFQSDAKPPEFHLQSEIESIAGTLK